jgi:hypothetical protein
MNAFMHAREAYFIRSRGGRNTPSLYKCIENEMHNVCNMLRSHNSGCDVGLADDLTVVESVIIESWDRLT